MRPTRTRVHRQFHLLVASLYAVTALASGALIPTAVAAPPPGFSYQEVASGWVDAVGTTFTSSGRMFVWERAGRVWTVDNGVKSATPFIDLYNEVGSWGDHGLLGFALHPNFEINGYVYLLYVVDRDHLLNCDASIYDPSCSATTTDYHSATIGRITRYQANLPTGATDYLSATSTDPLSRTVILGKTADSGCPILFHSHGVGRLLFGADATLFATCGDGASDILVDTGNSGDTYWDQALSGTVPPIIRSEENVGAYRAQMVNSLSGKLIRIDPMTGDGVSTNPWYDPQAPRAPPSRIWSLGLRDPLRIALVSESGSHNPNDGTPGVLLMGDAGLAAWQEFNVARFGGDNFGSPLFEGMDPHPGYSSDITFNRDASNPLFGSGDCTQQNFSFQDLIGSYGSLPLKNPCNGAVDIPSTIPTHTHQKPEIDWSNDTVTARWSNATGQHFDVGTNGLTGSMFSGGASTGGVWYSGTDFPASYRNTYFHADSAAGWIRRFVLDANDRVQSVLPFDDAAGPVVDMATSPTDGSLYVVLRNGGVKRVVYNAEQMQVPLEGQVVRLDVVNDAGDLAPGLANAQVNPNAPPVVLFTGSPLVGAAPLTVAVNGTGSSDSDGTIVGYGWTFGDGGTGSGVTASHLYTTAGTYTITLTVTDDGGATASTTATVNVQGNWWDVGWGARRELTFNTSGITEAQLNFPVLVKLTPANFDYTQVQANGADLRFIDADGMTVLSHEIATFNVGGESLIWVKVPQIEPNSTTDSMTLYWNNPTAADGQDRSGVWSNGYAGVWHFDGDLNDSTSNANHGVNQGTTAATGYLGGARSFNGTSSYIGVANAASLAPANTLTLEAWVRPTVDVSSGARIINKKNLWTDTAGYELTYKGTPNLLSSVASGRRYGRGIVDLDDGAWHYVAATFNGVVAQLYGDGNNVTTLSAITPVVAGTQPLAIGRDGPGASPFAGLIDEVRISNVHRSHAWITTQRRSMDASLVTFGAGVSNARPTVSLTAPATGAAFAHNASSIALTANAADRDGNVVRVDFYADGGLIGSATTAPYGITWVGPAVGSHTLTAVAVDDDNAGTVSTPVNVVINTAPTVTVTSPAQGASVLGPNVTVNYTIMNRADAPTPVATENNALRQQGRWFAYRNAPLYLAGGDTQDIHADSTWFDYTALLDKFETYRINTVRIIIDPLNFRSVRRPYSYDVATQKYDLDTWDTTYWENTRDFVEKARDRGIMVMLGMSLMYPNWTTQWDNLGTRDLPVQYNKANNINNAFTTNAGGDFYPQWFQLTGYTEVSNTGLTIFDYQKRLYDKALAELGEYPNIMWQVHNEPGTFGQTGAEVVTYQNYWAAYLDARTDRPVDVMVDNDNGILDWMDDFWNNSNVTVLDSHYAGTSDPGVISSAWHSAQLKGKLFFMSEGGLFNDWYTRPANWWLNPEIPWTLIDAGVNYTTQEMWGMFLSGVQMHWYNLHQNVTGWERVGTRIKVLRDVVDTLANLGAMSPVDANGSEYDSLVSAGPSGANHQVLANPGNEYVVYFWGTPSATDVNLVLSPGGSYNYKFYDPRDGTLISSGEVTSNDGATVIPSPSPDAWAGNVGLALVVTNTFGSGYDHVRLLLDGVEVAITNPMGSYTFTNVAPGEHIVVAQLEDAQNAVLAGAGATATVGFTVLAPAINQPPSVNVGEDRTVAVAETVDLQAAVVDDGSPNPPGAITLQWTLQSGPATPMWPRNDAAQAHTQVVFPIAGTYVLRLTANDGQDTAIDELTVTATAPNAPPVVSFTGSPLLGLAPLTVTVSGTGSSDGDGTIGGYAWTFGDGGTGSGVAASYVYTTEGTYTITLTVTDDEGATASTTAVVSVLGSVWNVW